MFFEDLFFSDCPKNYKDRRGQVGASRVIITVAVGRLSMYCFTWAHIHERS